MQIRKAVRPKGAPQKYHVYVDPGDGLVHAQNNRTGITDHTGTTTDVVLAALLTDLGSRAATITLSDDTHSLAANVTPPANVGVQAVHGTLLKPASGVTLTLNGHLDAGPYQIFDLSAGGSVALGAAALAKGVRLEWFGANLTGATDSSGAWTSAIAALPANGGVIHVGQGTVQFGNVALAAEPKTIDIIGEGIGRTVFIPNAANTPLFVMPSVGVWSKGRMEGFSTKAHASGSTGAALPLWNARTVVLKDVEYLSNAGADFAAWIEVGKGHSYGITLDHPVMQGQVGPVKVISFINDGDSGSNCNIATIKNGWFYANSGTGTIIDALRSALVKVEDTEFEDNTNYTCIVPGTKMETHGNWYEGNAAWIVPATLAGQGTTNNGVFGPDYISSPTTVTFPVGCTNSVLNQNHPDANLSFIDNDKTNAKEYGLVRGTSAVDGIYPFRNAAAGASLWQLISAATGSSFGGAGSLVWRNATTAARVLLIDGGAVDLSLELGTSSATFAKVVIMPQLAFTGGNRISVGSGAPTSPGGHTPTMGDFYIRTDTPTTATQRLYMCSVGGGSPTWVGIV